MNGTVPIGVWLVSGWRDREHPKILAEIGKVTGAVIDVGEVWIVAAQQEELGRRKRLWFAMYVDTGIECVRRGRVSWIGEDGERSNRELDLVFKPDALDHIGVRTRIAEYRT